MPAIVNLGVRFKKPGNLLMMNFRTFETERLILKPTSIEDAGFIFELLNSPKWFEYIGDRKIKNLKDAENYILQKMIPQLEKLGFSNNTIIRKSDFRKIGSCGIYDRSGLANFDIGYALLPEFENMGYAYEATSKLKEVAKIHFGITDLNAITLEKNQSSRKLMEKLNFEFQEKIRLPEDPEELMLYALKL